MDDVVPAPVVRPAPDPERDARIAARREAARRRASADLDRFIGDLYGEVVADRHPEESAHVLSWDTYEE